MKIPLIYSLLSATLLYSPQLSAHEQDEVAQLWQKYTEPNIPDRLLSEPELTHTLLTHWETIMQQRRRCDVTIHWDGAGAYGSISYRTQDLPHEMVQQRHAFRTNLARTGKLSEEDKKRHLELLTREENYIYSAPDAEKIDTIIRHIHREEYPQAIKQLARLRREHPHYSPQAFAELASALATPRRPELLLLCTKLPLGVIRETHLVE